MTPNQERWALERNRLAGAAASLGYPEEFADLLAGQLGSPKAIGRMASYLIQARPGSMEMIIDEMLAIRAEADAWREKKESRAGQTGYSAWLRSDARLRMEEDVAEDRAEKV